MKEVAVGDRWEELQLRPKGIRFEVERLQLIRKLPGETSTEGRIAEREGEKENAQKVLLSSAADKSFNA